MADAPDDPGRIIVQRQNEQLHQWRDEEHQEEQSQRCGQPYAVGCDVARHRCGSHRCGPQSLISRLNRSIQAERCSLIFFQSWNTNFFFSSAVSFASTVAISPPIGTLEFVGTIR